jgi:hypothetical protein
MIESTALDLTIVNVINLHKQSTFVLQYLIIKVALCSKALLIVVLTCRLIHLKITTFSLLKNNSILYRGIHCYSKSAIFVTL